MADRPAVDRPRLFVPPRMPPRQGSRLPPPRLGSCVSPERLRHIPPHVQRRIDMHRAVRARIDRCEYLRAVGGKEAEQELQQIEAEEVLEHQKILRERSKPLYLCDQSAVQILVKAVTEGPSALGAWVQQQLKAGCLWSCTAVDAVPGWKLYTFESELVDNGRPFLLQRVFKKLCVEVSNDALSEYPKLYDTMATYARVHSFVEDGPADALKRLVTANRAFESLVLASEERRSATLLEFFGLSYVLRRGTSGPVVLFVDDVHQEKPEGLPFQEGDIASAEAMRVQHLNWPAQAAAPC